MAFNTQRFGLLSYLSGRWATEKRRGASDRQCSWGTIEGQLGERLYRQAHWSIAWPLEHNEESIDWLYVSETCLNADNKAHSIGRLEQCCGGDTADIMLEIPKDLLVKAFHCVCSTAWTPLSMD